MISFEILNFFIRKSKLNILRIVPMNAAIKYADIGLRQRDDTKQPIAQSAPDAIKTAK